MRNKFWTKIYLDTGAYFDIFWPNACYEMMSPGSQALSDKADIYSMAMILYSLLAGRKPFEDQQSLELALSEGGRPAIDSSWHRGFVEVINYERSLN